jgi:5-methyltetrahydrofolate corrinoid/iron sulfur protein methyltransferase
MFKDVRAAIQGRDKKAIQDLARKQLDSCAQALDLNVGPASDKPIEAMLWLVEAVREVTQAPLAIDSPKWEVQEAVIPKVPGEKIINSCKSDEDALVKYVDLAVKNGAGLVALCIDEKGVPSDVEKRVELGALAATKAMEGGMAMDKLFIDPIIVPVNVAPTSPTVVMEAMRQLQLVTSPPPHLILGLSNVSQGCKQRHLVNRIYLVMAMSAGMDAVIADPMDTELMDAGITTEMMTGKTIYCDSFLDAYRMQVKSGRK